jgi:hemerythrin-like domain-containing protein
MYSVEQLLRVSRGEESARTTIGYPLEHLVACHRRIEERLEMLQRAGAHLSDAPADAFQAIDAALRYFDSSGVMHTADEELSVFPRLRPRLAAQELAEIEQLERQHVEADAIYAELKAVAGRLRENPRDPALGDAYRGLAARLAALYRSHIAFEDRELIRIAQRDLTPGDLEVISREMRSRRERAR